MAFLLLFWHGVRDPFRPMVPTQILKERIMGTTNLHTLFNPQSIAVIGASERKNSVGFCLMKNLLGGTFNGRIIPVNPKGGTLMGLAAVSGVECLDSPPDLAVIATPIRTVCGIIEALGKIGTPAAIIISAGGKEIGEGGRGVEAEILAVARQYGIRLIGPNCLGIMNTAAGLNASFSHVAALPGRTAFLSQSGAVLTSVLDLARQENLGFSHVVSLGSMADVDFADMIDYLGGLASVDTIVMYLEQVTGVRKFMSAARAVSRVKPIIALKAGRSEAGTRAAASHTGAMVGDDAVYDAAFQRAGILRVGDFEELLECTRFLARLGRPKGPGLTVVTNAGGHGVMAADALEAYGLCPAVLKEETLRELDLILPANWSRGNPVDVLGDTPARGYVDAVRTCALAEETDALLLLCSPAGTLDPKDLALQLTSAMAHLDCPVFTAFIGGTDMAAARQVFNKAGIVTYGTAERAVRAFKNLYHYGLNLERLMEIPVRTDRRLRIDRSAAGAIIHGALSRGRESLSEIEAKDLLRAYGLPVNATAMGETRQEALATAEKIGYPVVLKICSPDILHKSDTGCVVRGLENRQQVKDAFDGLLWKASTHHPDARIFGVSVQPDMGVSDYELIIGAKADPQFGPVIVFGTGGVMTEVVKDTAMGLPPLNRSLAREMMAATKISTVLKGFRNLTPVKPELAEEMLIRVSRLVTDFPQIQELDINPLMVKNGVVTVVDARVLLRVVSLSAAGHLIISSYPFEYEKDCVTENGHLFFIRPIRPSDADLLIAHFYSLSPKSVYMRFFTPLKELSQKALVRLTQIDYDREIALVALMGKGESRKMVGVCRIIMGPDRSLGEFAMAISDVWQGQGIGSALLSRCLMAARQMGVAKVMGLVLAENRKMLQLGRKMGFGVKRVSDSGEYELSIDMAKVPNE